MHIASQHFVKNHAEKQASHPQGKKGSQAAADCHYKQGLGSAHMHTSDAHVSAPRPFCPLCIY